MSNTEDQIVTEEAIWTAFCTLATLASLRLLDKGKSNNVTESRDEDAEENVDEQSQIYIHTRNGSPQNLKRVCGIADHCTCYASWRYNVRLPRIGIRRDAPGIGRAEVCHEYRGERTLAWIGGRHPDYRR